MEVYLYSGMQKLIEKSGVGRAIYHQKTAAKMAGITCVDNYRDADIIHINTVFPKSLHMAHLARKKHIPVVYHAHSTKEDFKNSYLGSNLFDELFGKWIKHCYNSTDMVITPSGYAKGLLEKDGIQKDITVLSNGIDLSYYQPEEGDRENFRKKFGFKEDDKVIMSAGLWIERKGLLDFVELAKAMPEYKFIWFGDSNLYTVSHKIRKAVFTNLPNLLFAGYVPREELKKAYAACDLFLFPSKEETEGIVILEAMAMKIPILLRDIPVYEDWIRTNEDAYKAKDLREFQELTTKILENQVPSLIDNAYEVAKNRDLKNVSRKLKEIYQYAINNYRF